MFAANCLDVNDNGHLTIGGVDTLALAQQYGTPLYVMDEAEIRRACRSYRQSITDYYGSNGMVVYAGKALLCKEICRVIAQEDIGLDVVSGGELFTALEAGFPMDRVVFHGNNKTVEELTMAVRNGVGRIVVDNLCELELLAALAASAKRQMDILLRVKPGIDAHTHNFVRTGQIDSKFGLALETGEAFEAVRAALEHEYLSLQGIHCHIGSQIFDIDPFEHAAQVMMDFVGQVKRGLDYELRELNLGGGFGIRYVDQDDPVPYGSYMRRVSAAVKAAADKNGVALPKVMIEPGRSIVGSAGITLYMVGCIKDIPGVRKYVSVDGGMTDNPRYALYHSEYEAVIANRAAEQKDHRVTVAGKCCESGDLIGENMLLQTPQVGDVLAVLSTGAYNFSMASNYNRLLRPAMVMVNEGKARLIVRRQAYEDLVAHDL